MSPASTPRWPAVVFDLDGTLVDTIALIIESYQHAFRSVLEMELPETRIRSWIGQPLLRCFQQAALEHAPALFDSYSVWNQANTERLARPYAGIDRMLVDLGNAGARLAVATSKRLAPAQVALTLCGLDRLVDTLITMEDTDRHKPDPDPLLLAAQRLGVAPEHTAYVGDAVVDLQAARNAGMSAVAVLWGAGTREALEAEEPSAVVHTVQALRELLLPSAAPAEPGRAPFENVVQPAGT